jgi:hypothetical protein
MAVTRGDTEGMLALIWEALHSHRENCIPEGGKEHDEEWDEICTAMAWIREDLGLGGELEDAGSQD